MGDAARTARHTYRRHRWCGGQPGIGGAPWGDRSSTASPDPVLVTRSICVHRLDGTMNHECFAVRHFGRLPPTRRDDFRCPHRPGRDQSPARADSTSRHWFAQGPPRLRPTTAVDVGDDRRFGRSDLPRSNTMKASAAADDGKHNDAASAWPEGTSRGQYGTASGRHNKASEPQRGGGQIRTRHVRQVPRRNQGPAA